MAGRARKSLKLIEAPSQSAVVTAPPIIVASNHTVDYCCGHCGTLLMQAEEGQINNLLIRCTQCGSTNSTDL
jgi:DNA-directed RNA polymerase subunit RPC12/RpoP